MAIRRQRRPAARIKRRRSATAAATLICWPVMAQVSASQAVGRRDMQALPERSSGPSSG
jgi:hypothetical protein